MDSSNFSTHPSGKVIKALQGYWAYVPSPLEPEIEVGLDLVKVLSAADRALSELAGIARTLPNPHLLIKPFVRREAVLSSKIEGTQASLSDLFYFEAEQRAEPKVPDVREVRNYVVALEYGLLRLNELPLSQRLIKEVHALLMAGVRGEDKSPGEFRGKQNWIGPLGCSLSEATYVPPPVPEMKQALHDFELYLHSESKYPALIRLALIHYQFEAIHPFDDGNGRIGRLLIPMLLCAEEILPAPLLYLSAFFEKHRPEYYRLLLGVSQRGEWNAWVRYFLTAVATQARDAIARSDRVLALWQSYRNRLQSARSSALLLQLVDQLFATPAMSNSRVAEVLDVTARSAQLNVNKLIDEGILSEVTGKQRNRIYMAVEIMQVLDAETP